MSLQMEDLKEDKIFLGDQDKDEVPEEDQVPEPTKWRWLCRPMNLVWQSEPGDYIKSYLPKIMFIHLKLFPYWPCISLLIASLPLFNWYIAPYLPHPHRTIQIIFNLAYIHCAINFLIVHFMHPGFLPWNWALTKKSKYTDDELRDGYGVFTEQRDWCRSHSKPARSCYSQTYGFIVVRGDHDCVWINNWVGIRNHRYFMLAVYSGSILSFIYTYCVIRLWFLGEIHVHKIIFYFYAAYFGWGCYVHTGQAILQTYHTYWNVTQNEIYKGISSKKSPYNRGCLNNFEEICGTRKFIFLWWLPIPIPKVIDGLSYAYHPDAEEEENAPFIPTF